tara:strand:- start:25463 stop:33394 length:7932 start_codon:yes stop_codon:yes gene_type:complete
MAASYREANSPVTTSQFLDSLTTQDEELRSRRPAPASVPEYSSRAGESAPDFRTAMEFTSTWEGGMANSPDDRGGETAYGVSSKYWPEQFAQVKATLEQQGEEAAKQVRDQFFEEEFYNKVVTPDMNNQEAMVIFDTAVNHGHSKANKLWQESGGDLTKFLDAREQFYYDIAANDPSQESNLEGWIARNTALRNKVAGMATAPTEEVIERSGSEKFLDRLEFSGNPIDSFTAADDRGTFSKSLDRGMSNLGGMMANSEKAIGDWINVDALSQLGEQGILDHAYEAANNPAEYESIDDVEGLAELGDWVVELIGEQLPNTATLLGTGGVGAVAGITGRAAIGASFAARAASVGAGTGRALVTATRAGRLQKVDKLRAAKAKGEALKGGAKVGAGVGGYSLGLGEVTQELQDAGIAPDPFGTLLIAGGIAALDVLSLGGQIKAFFPGAKDIVSTSFVHQVAGKFGIATGKGALYEAPTEAMQEVLVLASRKYHDPTYEMFTDENIKRIRDAGIAGGIVGGAFTGAGSVAPSVGQYIADTPRRQKYLAEKKKMEKAAAVLYVDSEGGASYKKPTRKRTVVKDGTEQEAAEGFLDLRFPNRNNTQTPEGSDEETFDDGEGTRAPRQKGFFDLSAIKEEVGKIREKVKSAAARVNRAAGTEFATQAVGVAAATIQRSKKILQKHLEDLAVLQKEHAKKTADINSGIDATTEAVSDVEQNPEINTVEDPGFNDRIQSILTDTNLSTGAKAAAVTQEVTAAIDAAYETGTTVAPKELKRLLDVAKKMFAEAAAEKNREMGDTQQEVSDDMAWTDDVMNEMPEEALTDLEEGRTPEQGTEQTTKESKVDAMAAVEAVLSGAKYGAQISEDYITRAFEVAKAAGETIAVLPSWEDGKVIVVLKMNEREARRMIAKAKQGGKEGEAAQAQILQYYNSKPNPTTEQETLEVRGVETTNNDTGGVVQEVLVDKDQVEGAVEAASGIPNTTTGVVNPEDSQGGRIDKNLAELERASKGIAERLEEIKHDAATIIANVRKAIEKVRESGGTTIPDSTVVIPWGKTPLTWGDLKRQIPDVAVELWEVANDEGLLTILEEVLTPESERLSNIAPSNEFTVEELQALAFDVYAPGGTVIEPVTNRETGEFSFSGPKVKGFKDEAGARKSASKRITKEGGKWTVLEIEGEWFVAQVFESFSDKVINQAVQNLKDRVAGSKPRGVEKMALPPFDSKERGKISDNNPGLFEKMIANLPFVFEATLNGEPVYVHIASIVKLGQVINHGSAKIEQVNKNLTAEVNLMSGLAHLMELGYVFDNTVFDKKGGFSFATLNTKRIWGTTTVGSILKARQALARLQNLYDKARRLAPVTTVGMKRTDEVVFERDNKEDEGNFVDEDEVVRELDEDFGAAGVVAMLEEENVSTGEVNSSAETERAQLIRDIETELKRLGFDGNFSESADKTIEMREEYSDPDKPGDFRKSDERTEEFGAGWEVDTEQLEVQFERVRALIEAVGGDTNNRPWDPSLDNETLNDVDSDREAPSTALEPADDPREGQPLKEAVNKQAESSRVHQGQNDTSGPKRLVKDFMNALMGGTGTDQQLNNVTGWAVYTKIVRGVLDKFGIKEKVLILNENNIDKLLIERKTWAATLASELSKAEKFGNQENIKLVKELIEANDIYIKSLEHMKTRPAGRTTYNIDVNPKYRAVMIFVSDKRPGQNKLLSQAKRFHILAHELGHLVMATVWANSPAKVRAQVAALMGVNGNNVKEVFADSFAKWLTVELNKSRKGRKKLLLKVRFKRASEAMEVAREAVDEAELSGNRDQITKARNEFERAHNAWKKAGAAYKTGRKQEELYSALDSYAQKAAKALKDMYDLVNNLVAEHIKVGFPTLERFLNEYLEGGSLFESFDKPLNSKIYTKGFWFSAGMQASTPNSNKGMMPDNWREQSAALDALYGSTKSGTNSDNIEFSDTQMKYWATAMDWAKALLWSTKETTKRAVLTADAQLRGMGPVGVTLARRFWARPGERDKNGNAIKTTIQEMINRLGGPLETALEKLLETLPGILPTDVKGLFESVKDRATNPEKAKEGAALLKRISMALASEKPLEEIDTDLVPYVKAVREYLDKAHEFFTETMGLSLNKVENYFPFMIKTSELELRKAEFYKILQEDGYSMQYIDALYQNLTESSDGGLMNSLDENIDNGLLGPSNPYANPRKWTPELRAKVAEAGFTVTDIPTVLVNYTKTLVRKAVYTKEFGYSKEELTEELLSELERRDINPGNSTAKLQNDLARAVENGTLDREAYKRIEKVILPGYFGRLGMNMNPVLRDLSSWVVVYQNVRLLGMALLSSFVDMGNLAYRAKSIPMTDMIKAFREASSEDARAMANMLGVIRNGVADSVHNDISLTSYGSNTAKKMNDWFFRFNLMEGWTNQMRTMAMLTGIEFIKHHGAEASKGNETSIEYLKELNLTAEDVMNWDGVDINDNKIGAGLHRFIDQSVVRPNSAIRPPWANDPRYGVLFHLKTFIYAYQEVFLRQVMNDAKGQKGLAKALPFLVLASFTLPIAAAGWELRKAIKGQDLGPDDDDEMFFAYLWEVINRSGNLGMLQFLSDMEAASSYDKPAIMGIAGPTVEQAYDVVTKADDEWFPRAVPLANQFDWSRRALRGMVDD